MTEEASAATTDAPAEQTAAADRTFTQADLDKVVQDRLARERAKYEGFDDLKAKAAEFDKLQDAQRTEVEKATARAEKAEKDAAKRTESANARLIQAAVLAEASKQKAIKPEHLHLLIDRQNVTVEDDGQVAGVEDAVKAFLEANPEYVGSTRTSGFADQGARSGRPPTNGSFDDVIRQRAGR